MHIEFYGATSGITGSCHILRTEEHLILLDCGLIQGRREVEAFLSTRLDKTAAVEDYRRQRIVLHRLFDHIEDRRLPNDLLSLAAQADRALRIVLVWRQNGAVLAKAR